MSGTTPENADTPQHSRFTTVVIEIYCNGKQQDDFYYIVPRAFQKTRELALESAWEYCWQMRKLYQDCMYTPVNVIGKIQ